MRSSVRWFLATWVVTTAALGLPAVAGADGTITKVGGQLRFVSGAQDAENLVITRQTAAFECNPGPTPCIQFANGPQLVTDMATGCVQVIATVVACTFPGVTSIALDMRDGDDFVRLGDAIPPTSISGGSGADNLSSDDGTDNVDGGEGDDLLSPGFGNEVVTGGPGIDTVVLENGDDTVRLDGAANDGRPGETKNIAADNEIINGGGGGDLLFGDAGANTLNGGGGNDLLDGGPGADVLIGGSGADDIGGGADVDRVDYPGTGAQAVTLDGIRDDGIAGELDNVHADIENVDVGAGNDAVTGNDAANSLVGGEGDDRLDGRGGEDAFSGGPGADVLFARDGLAEPLDCGPDTDTGAGDTIDALVGCEGVVLAPDLVPDADGDGVAKPADCNDLDPAIRPGVVDVPGNAVDEDCTNGPAPFPPLGSTIGVAFRFGPEFTQFTSLTIRRVKAGSRLRLKCRGRGCPFRSRTRTRGLGRDRAKLAIVRPLKKARLKPGARFIVRLTKPGSIGVFLRFKVRPGKPPLRRERCLPPGATDPLRCAG